jgi:hypothetical protein
VFAYTGDITSSSCYNGTSALGFSGTIILQGSIDNVKWSQISTVGTNPTNANTNTTPIIAFGIGLYPYLRVLYSNASNATCNLTIWYTGSISPNAYSGSPRVVNDNFQTAYIHFSSSGDNIVASCSTTLNTPNIVLYGLYLYNPAAANTLNIGTGVSTGFVTWLTLTSFQQYAQLSAMPVTGKPYFVSYSGVSGNPFAELNIKLTNSSEVDGFAVYRCE